MKEDLFQTKLKERKTMDNIDKFIFFVFLMIIAIKSIDIDKDLKSLQHTIETKMENQQ